MDRPGGPSVVTGVLRRGAAEGSVWERWEPAFPGGSKSGAQGRGQGLGASKVALP